MEDRVNKIPADRGLRHRLQRAARRVADQHQSINDLYKSLSDGLAESPKSEVRREFDRYRLALTAHFELEEGVFFPAVHGADASQHALIRQLIAIHSRMRAELVHLADSIESLPSDEFSRRLVGFATILSSHERQEEMLLTHVSEFSSIDRNSAAQS
jgi:transposase